MKKYRVTEKHGFIKQNFEIHQSKNNKDVYVLASIWAHPFSSNEINDWINGEWVEEIQEPEFTYQDVINILHRYDDDYIEDSKPCDFIELVNKYKDEH